MNHMNRPKAAKQVKVEIYPETLEQLKQLPEFDRHGLTYAVNARLAESFGLEMPATPREKMQRAGAAATGTDKDPGGGLLRIPVDWPELLEMLVTETGNWKRIEHPDLALLCKEGGLAQFVPGVGASATAKLRQIWKRADRDEHLLELWRSIAAARRRNLHVEQNR